MSEHVQAGPQQAQKTTSGGGGGGQSLSPPGFSLSAQPVQMQANSCDPPSPENQQCTVDDWKTSDASVPEFNMATALSYNDGKEFRLDWVRNLQQVLIGEMRSTNGTFDEETVNMIARFQLAHFGEGDVDGKIGPNTRRKLEEVYPVLMSTITGDHLDSRVLVPGNANEQDRYGYYRQIIEQAGGVFLTEAMAMNLLGIRGVKIADGSEAHQVNGETLAANTLYQTESAQDFVNARAAGETDDHVSGLHDGFDDMMISLWVDAAGTVHVQERRGNVDPRSLYSADDYGTGHLMDGQYAYQVGQHSTASASHREAVAGISDPDNLLRRNDFERGGRQRTGYQALIPTRNQEVWREHGANDRYVSESEEETSRERIYGRNNRYVNDNFAMNIHTSSVDHPNSQACMNVPADNYLEFMEEIFASSNQRNVLFTLIDASKINDGLVLMSQEQQ